MKQINMKSLIFRLKSLILKPPWIGYGVTRFYMNVLFSIPELLAYYSLSCGEGNVYETSNGCALGGSLEEAIFHGIMEVVETRFIFVNLVCQAHPPTRLIFVLQTIQNYS